MHMIEVGCIHYLAPEKCPSRHDEINVTRPEQQLTFDGQGMVKIAKRELDLRCDISGELRLRDALRRKALAFDLAGLASFERLEEWHTQMFQAMTRQPPAGYKFVTTQQVMAADRQLWALVSQESRQQLILEVGNPPPLNNASGQAHPSLGKILRGRLLYAAPPSQLGRRRGGREKPPPKKRPTKEDRPDPPKKHKELLASLPEGCSSKNKEGKFRRLYFNKGLCRFQKKKRCNLGLMQQASALCGVLPLTRNARDWASEFGGSQFWAGCIRRGLRRVCDTFGRSHENRLPSFPHRLWQEPLPSQSQHLFT